MVSSPFGLGLRNYEYILFASFWLSLFVRNIPLVHIPFVSVYTFVDCLYCLYTFALMFSFLSFIPGTYWFRKCEVVEPFSWKDLACLYGADCFTENSPPHHTVVLGQVQTMDCGMCFLSPSNTDIYSLRCVLSSYEMKFSINANLIELLSNLVHLNFTLVGVLIGSNY